LILPQINVIVNQKVIKRPNSSLSIHRYAFSRYIGGLTDQTQPPTPTTEIIISIWAMFLLFAFEIAYIMIIRDRLEVEVCQLLKS
jgi:hypothetical protein